VVIGFPQSDKVLALHIAELNFFPRIKVSKGLIASSLLSLRTEQSEHSSPRPEKGEPCADGKVPAMAKKELFNNKGKFYKYSFGFCSWEVAANQT